MFSNIYFIHKYTNLLGLGIEKNSILDSKVERDPIEQRRRQREAREAREEEERKNMAREEEEGQLRLDRIREDAIIAHEAYLQDLLEEEQTIRRETTVAVNLKRRNKFTKFTARNND